jgi:8-oxo-dGTP pyrophosphatase MutT (NUDIX family)
MLRQSGVIPYRIRKGRIEILLITVSNQKRWGIPKGWIEPRMSAVDSAAKEAYEEAGILGAVHTPALGHYERRKWGLPCRVEVFLMHVDQVLDNWAEADERKRCWLSLSQAQKQVKKPELKALLIQLQELPLERLATDFARLSLPT